MVTADEIKRLRLYGLYDEANQAIKEHQASLLRNGRSERTPRYQEEIRSAYHRRYYARVAKNLCIRCGKPAKYSQHHQRYVVLCVEHSKQASEKNMLQYEKRKAAKREARTHDDTER
jgi:hypothetical protein